MTWKVAVSCMACCCFAMACSSGITLLDSQCIAIPHGHPGPKVQWPISWLDRESLRPRHPLIRLERDTQCTVSVYQPKQKDEMAEGGLVELVLRIAGGACVLSLMVRAWRFVSFDAFRAGLARAVCCCWSWWLEGGSPGANEPPGIRGRISSICGDPDRLVPGDHFLIYISLFSLSVLSYLSMSP